MTNHHRKKTVSNNTPNVSDNGEIGLNDAAPWPMTSYISIVGVHASLWVFVALYLPRSTSLLNMENPEWDRIPVSSCDRPQHPFFESLTTHPTLTLIFICLGGAILQCWWACWTRDWWLRLGIRGTPDERRTERAFYDRQKFTVRSYVDRFFKNIEPFGQVFRNAWGATFVASFFIHFALILFGAPITRFSGIFVHDVWTLTHQTLPALS